MPLFEWQISEIVTDLPPDVHISSSPWITRWGESLADESYILDQVNVSSDGLPCQINRVNSIPKRSQNDEALERLSLSIKQKFTSSVGWNLFGFVLCLCGGIYVWWFALWSERPISDAFIFSAIVIIIYIFLAVGIWRQFPPVGSIHFNCSGISDQYHGTLAFSARLWKVYYETLLVLFTGICAELGALGVMVHQIIKAILEGKESSSLAVG